jgi:dihydroxyacetone kinase
MVRAQRRGGKPGPAEKMSIKYLLERSYHQPGQADAGKGGDADHGLDSLGAQGNSAATEVDFVV